MVNEQSNEPAYPVPQSGHTAPYFGLTKRELFAAMAMQSAYSMHMEGTRDTARDAKLLAAEAITIADALLDALTAAAEKRGAL